MRLEIYSVQGYNPMQLARYVWFLEGVNGVQLNYHEAYIRPSGIDSPLLRLLHAKYLVVPHPITRPTGVDSPYTNSPHQTPAARLVPGSRIVFSNGLVDVVEMPSLPYAHIVHQAVERPENQVMATLISGTYNPETTAIIEGAPPRLNAPAPGSSDRVVVTSYAPDEITLSATAAADGILVVSEVYAPGWRAYVDGKEVDILPTNYIQRGVALPAGEHTVVFRYDPLSLKVGLWLTGITMTVALSILVAAAYVKLERRLRDTGVRPSPLHTW